MMKKSGLIHIYMITCKNPAITDKYIGQTSNVVARRRVHKTKTATVTGIHQRNSKLYQFIRANGGWENFTLIPFTTVEADKANETEEYFRRIFGTLNTNRSWSFNVSASDDPVTYGRVWHQANADYDKKRYIRIRDTTLRKAEYEETWMNMLTRDI